MSKTTMMVLGVCVLMAVLAAAICVGTVFSANNKGVSFETQIKAQYEQNKNNLSQYSNKVAEAAQVPTMYRDDFTKVVQAQMQGRYGKEGSKASFQWLKEHNVQFDSTLYVQMQRMIEAGRNDFEQNQKVLIDKKRLYQKALDSMPTGIVMRFIGFPKIDLNKFGIVTSDFSDKAFATGKENGLKLR